MISRKALRLHAGLVDDMASALDVDFEEAALAGDVSVEQIADAVLRCTECPNPAHCKSVLEQGARLQKTPEYCRNQKLLNALAP